MITFYFGVVAIWTMIINDISVKDIINTVCQDIIYILVYL